MFYAFVLGEKAMENNESKSSDFYIGRVSAVEKHPATVDEFFFWTQPLTNFSFGHNQM